MRHGRGNGTAPIGRGWKHMTRHDPLAGKLVTLIGGGGFLGRHTAEALLRRGARLRIADRRPEKAYYLRPLADLGQIQFARCDVKDTHSVERAVAGADAVVYLVGTWGADQQELQADGAGHAAYAATAQACQAFAYVSAIGADAQSDSGYAATKGDGEDQVRAAFPRATVLRPSVLFGDDDQFINLFARLIMRLPAMPVFGAQARVQPLFVDDAAEAIGVALADPKSHGGKTYEIAGPEVLTMGDLHRRIAAAQGRERGLIEVPDPISALFAALPGTPMNSDQWALLKRGSVASDAAPGLAELGVTPRPLGLFLERWMVRYRKHGRFGDKRAPA
ncbi:MAG: complex I NDUFA9 subunit family protein [Croceibacterium sp.]